jgi:hypothetical protein
LGTTLPLTGQVKMSARRWSLSRILLIWGLWPVLLIAGLVAVVSMGGGFSLDLFDGGWRLLAASVLLGPPLVATLIWGRR